MIILFSLLLSSTTWATQAQPVPIPENPSIAPQVEISGVGIATVNYKNASGLANPNAALNFSDSALFLGAAQRLHDGAIGSFGLGGMTTEESNQGTSSALFLHQAFVNYQSKSFEATLGRSDNPTAHLVDFPTLHGDDLITFTNPQNPFSNGSNQEEHRYSNVASFTWNQNLRYYLNVHGQHLISSSNVGNKSGLNSFGASFGYLADPGLEAFRSLPSWGLGLEQITLHNSSPAGLHLFYAGGVWNLNESVTHRWDLRIFDSLNWGSRLTSLASVAESYQASANSLAASLRYLHIPFGKPGYQISLTLGQKKYFRISKASSIGGALTAAKRLGQGFDLVAQYQAQWRDRNLAAAQSSARTTEQTVEVGLSFNFDAMFNEHLTPRRSLLNQQHLFLPD